MLPLIRHPVHGDTDMKHIFISVMAIFAASQAHAEDGWARYMESEAVEAVVTNGDSSILVACGYQIGFIEFRIENQKAPGQGVTLLFDDLPPKVYQIDSDGRIDSRSRVDVGWFESALLSLKSHNRVTVRFEDGLSKTFALKGSSKAITADCTPVYYQDIAH